MLDQKTVSNENDESSSILDRVWAATRPSDLSNDDFDQIWANAKRACDCPSVLPMPTSRADRARWLLAWVPFGLANAAALLVAAWFLNRPVNPTHIQIHSAQVAAHSTVSPSTQYDIEPFETVVITLDGKVETERRVKADEESWLALNDVQANNQFDALNHWEDLSND